MFYVHMDIMNFKITSAMNRSLLMWMTFIILLSFSFKVNAQKIITEDVYTKKALKEIINKANQGEPDSQCLIGSLCLHGGEYVKKDVDLGLVYLHKSANQNFSPAFYELGNFSRAEGNVDKAVGYYKRSLDYFNDADTTYFQREDAVYKIWEIAAEKVIDGSVNDYDDYDILLEELVNKMTPSALELFEYIAEYNDLETIEMLLLYFYFYMEDYEKGVYYAKKAYMQNDYYSCFWLGDAYYWGRGVEKNIEKGIFYYEEGANNMSDNQGICRKTLSEICYRDKIMDKAFRYSYDYIHKADSYLIEYTSSTGELLQVLAECYRFGRGTEKSVLLADLYDLMAMWFSSAGWKEETIADYWGIEVDAPESVLAYAISHFNSLLTFDMIGLYPASCIIRGMYKLMKEKDFSKGQAYFVNAYHSESASEDDKLFVAYILKKIFEPLSEDIALSDQSRDILDEIEEGGIPLIDDDVFPIVFANVFFEQISVFENNCQ